MSSHFLYFKRSNQLDAVLSFPFVLRNADFPNKSSGEITVVTSTIQLFH